MVSADPAAQEFVSVVLDLLDETNGEGPDWFIVLWQLVGLATNSRLQHLGGVLNDLTANHRAASPPRRQ